MKNFNKVFTVVGITSLVILFVIGFYQKNQDENNVGSVAVGNSYKSMTNIGTTSRAYLVKSGSGTFGSVIISSIGTGQAIFYDATSTLPSKRTVTATSSLRVIAVVSASQAVGTYTYDSSYYDGLMVEYSGTQGTTTITYR